MSGAPGNSTVEHLPGKPRLRTWREGLRPDEAMPKANELVLPEGGRP